MIGAPSLDNTTPGFAGLSAVAQTPAAPDPSFQHLLDRRAEGAAIPQAGPGSDTGESGKDPLREAAQQLVAIALVKPMFEHMRNDTFRTDRFHGGAGEKAFAPMLHNELADRVTSAPGWPLVDSVVRALRPDAPVAPGTSGIPRTPGSNASATSIDARLNANPAGPVSGKRIDTRG
ncbi:MAG: hypothetical protein AAF288_07165 [Planctomycetota bacterium]